MYYLIKNNNNESKILRCCHNPNSRMIVLMNELNNRNISLVDDPYNVTESGRYAVGKNNNYVIYQTIIANGYLYGTSNIVTKLSTWQWIYFKPEKLNMTRVNAQFEEQLEE